MPPDATRERAEVAGSANLAFAHYEIDTDAQGLPIELGRGAMAVTYRATDTVLRCPAALKVIGVDLAAHPGARTRFLREAQAAAGLRHPHIASVFFFGERFEDGHPFYAMELVEGETLDARVRRTGGLPVDSVLEIGAQIVSALEAAAAKGVTHRDIKPANLMLAAGGAINVKVIDFGLAKAALAGEGLDASGTHAGEFIGTPAFASPEQFDGRQSIGARSDFYALGATLWFALTGEAPFTGATLAEIRDRQAHAPLPLARLRAARVPRRFEALLRSLLSADASGRPQTALELSQALAACRENSHRWRAAWIAPWAAAALFATGIAGWEFQSHWSPPPDKSVAVLPFESRSPDDGNAFFADGVQDEILTDLARIADLKVISRLSVLGYRDRAKRPPAREIGRALGVAYLLDGSVEREANRVRLRVQLIDSANGRQLWAQTFDRELSDVFSIQSGVAAEIAERLQAQVSGAEKKALSEPPTQDLAAYELYLHAKEIIYNFDPNASKWEPLYDSARLLEEATARDPAFFDAWRLLTNVYGNLLWFNADPSPVARAAQAEKALATVRRLRPDSGETHLTAATYYYNIHDAARGRPELALASKELPNNWRVLFVTATTGMIDGQWANALAAITKARTLNPRHLGTINMLTIIDGALRRYDDARRAADEAIKEGIGVDYFAMRRAAILQNQTGDTSEYHTVFDRLAGQGAPSERTVVIRWDTAMRDRNFDEAARVVATDPRPEFTARTNSTYPRAFLTGEIAYARGDLATARAAFATVRPVYEEAVRKRPEDAEALMNLADLDARLGRNEDALREGRHAVELLPISKDASEGPKMLAALAWIEAATGDKPRALSDLESLENVPNAYDFGYLGKHPDWDVLHGEPRFQALLQAIRAPLDLAKFHPANFAPAVDLTRSHTSGRTGP